jgi:hypothetical protein
MNIVWSAVNYSLSTEAYILEAVFMKMKKPVTTDWKAGDMLVVFCQLFVSRDETCNHW